MRIKSKEFYVKEIFKLLDKEYPKAATTLRYQTPFQLLVAVVLSAQTTDRQVNKITSSLFDEVWGPGDILSLGLPLLEKKLKGVGMYHQKSRQIMETSRLLCEKYDGVVPQTRDELMALPGVGRKTANVILSTAFDKPALAVDTHVSRVSRRLGLTAGKNVLEVEKDLCRLVPVQQWSLIHHLLITHGRQICQARKPLCMQCSLQPYCCHYLKECPNI